jgi:hypothetical protein
MSLLSVVYYESINRDLKIKPISECRCDERLKAKPEESIALGTRTPKDKDEVKNREV